LKKLLQIVLVLISNFTFAQNIWERINFPDTLHTKAINAEKEGILFVATGANNEFTGLFRSFNDGSTWELLEVDSASSYINIFSIRYNSDGVLFVGAGSGIYRSFDDGDNFEHVYSGGNNFLNINFSPSNEIFAVGWYYMVRSADNGDTWETLYTSVYNQCFPDVDFGLNGEIFTASLVYEAPGSGFYRSLDDGKTWENIGIIDTGLNAVKVKNDGIIIVCGYWGVFTSSDNGQTWNDVADIQANVMESNSDENLIAGQSELDGGCWFSDNWGETWISLLDTILNPYVHQISFSPDNHAYIQSNYSSSPNDQLFKSINPFLGINQPVSSPDIRLYPNPARSIISVLNNTSSRINQFVIYNQLGQKALCGRLADDLIDVSKLTPGLYIVEFELERSSLRMKVIIK
jgi:hypothetical protein